ncbi:MAG: DNA recombination protein RmuC [Chloroflexi bacterium]|nr:DNA recombination protein RmuC [Chloroflexota bacterium]
MSEVAFLVVGLVIGVMVVWFLMRNRRDVAPSPSDTFKAVAADALRDNNEMFLALARQTLETVLEGAKGDLGKREQAIEGVVRPLQESLQRYERQIQSIEERRQKVEGGLETQLKSIAETHQQLQKETNNLVNALRTPQVRGRWGELTLRRVAELAGMVDHCDFREQVSFSAEDGRERPDMVVYLPNSRQVVVDAKVSLDAYLQAIEATSEEDRRTALERHARQIRDHMNRLASKSYMDRLESTPDFVVMFIPGEPFIAAAVQHHPTLIEEGMEKRIVIATPTTLVALLKAVAYGWQEEQLTRNARQIGEMARELYDRTGILVGHLHDVGGGLGKALDSYNRAVGSLENRWLPWARRIKDLGGASEKDIPTLQPVTQTPRVLIAPETADVDESGPPEILNQDIDVRTPTDPR